MLDVWKEFEKIDPSLPWGLSKHELPANVDKSSKILKFQTGITPKYVTHSDDFLNRLFRNFYSAKNDIIIRK